LVVNVSPSATGDGPGEGVISKGLKGVVEEVEGECDVIGDLVVDTIRVGVLLVEPSEESLGGEVHGPGGHPGAEGQKSSVSEESVGHASLVGGVGKGGVEEVSELSEDVVGNGDQRDGEGKVGNNPGGLEEANKASNDTISTVANIVGGLVLGGAGPEIGLDSGVDSLEASISTSQRTNDDTGEGTEHSPENGEGSGEVVAGGGGTLVAEVELEHTKDGGDEGTEVIILVDGVEVVQDGGKFFPGKAGTPDALVGNVDGLGTAESGGISEGKGLKFVDEINDV